MMVLYTENCECILIGPILVILKVVDCPNSSDEKSCLTLAPTTEAAGYVHQYFNEGYLFVHDQVRKLNHFT